MTAENPTPAPLNPAAPAGAFYTPRRPPLSPRQKRGAFWAGAWGFTLLTLGFTLVILPIIGSLIGAFLSFVFTLNDRHSDDLSEGNRAIQDFFATVDVTLLVISGIAAVVVGLAVMTGALFLSKSILRSHGVARAWPVTWSGAGIAIAASWMLGWIPAFIVQMVSIPLRAMDVHYPISAIVTAVLGVILGVAAYAVMGWLAWWWMAHAFRSAQSVDSLASSNIQE